MSVIKGTMHVPAIENPQSEEDYNVIYPKTTLDQVIGAVKTINEVQPNENGDVTIENFVASGSGAKAGLVPAPSTDAGSDEFLCEDGTWKRVIRSVNGVTADSTGNVISIPVGFIGYYAKNATPSGFLYCNGSAVSRTTYKALFDVIGTTFGTGDGSTTFNLPNLVDKTVWGGTGVGTVKSAGLPNITGYIVPTFGTSTSAWVPFYFENGAFYGGNTSGATGSRQVSTVSGVSTTKIGLNFDASRSSNLYGNSSTVQPPALVLVPLIKY